MRKYLSLTRVLLKNSVGMMSDGKSKKKLNVLLYIVLAVCMLPLAFTLYKAFAMAITQLAAIDQQGAVLALGFHASALVTFLFSIFLIPSIFYFSKDSETLLSLPLPPQTILAGKFSVCVVYEYAFTLIVCLPLFIAYATEVGMNVVSTLFALVIFFTLPIYPLVLGSLITMLLMRFVPFFKNRDRFNMIAGVLSIVLAFSFSFAINSQNGDDASMLLAMMVEGRNSMIALFSKLFPAVPFAANALIDASILQLLGYLAICALALLVLLVCGKLLYFKGAIGFSETKSSRKQLSVQEVGKLSVQRNKVRTYLLKEWRLLVRTPVYALNCIGMCILMPLMIFLLYFTADIKTLLAQLPDITPYLDGTMPYAVLVGLALGFLMSNLNMISATAISREGTNISFMKYVPMSLRQQLQAKVGCGMLVSIVSLVLTMIALYIVFPILPFLYYLVAAASSLLTIALGNLSALLLDVFHPKLVWEQEAAAVKQNMNGVISMLGSMALTVLCIAFIFILPQKFLLLATIGIVVVCIVLDVVLYKWMEPFAKKCFDKI